MSKKAICSESEWKARFEDEWLMLARDECYKRIDILWRAFSHRAPEELASERFDD